MVKIARLIFVKLQKEVKSTPQKSQTVKKGAAHAKKAA